MSILRADSIRDRAGTGAPDFPNGLTGNVIGTASTATLANTATVATNAQGLTGTPNITVGTIGCGNVTSTGDVTGVNATFSGNVLLNGNLSVQGTTTTIDTAVTAVDTLAVDTKVAIGTDTYNTSDTVLQLNKNTSHAEVNIQSGNAHGALINFSDTDANGRGRIKYNHADDSLSIRTSGTDRFVITGDGTSIFKAGLAEKYNKGTTLAAASNNVAVTSGNVHRFTSNEAGAQTVNFTGVHATLGDGESVSFTVLVTPANNGYINAATVDGVAPGGGLKWSGGSAPSAGGASGRDVYTFTIFKDGTATDSYEIFGAVTNYA